VINGRRRKGGTIKNKWEDKVLKNEIKVHVI
jgi:hypothetical protein